jgi:hypothetical protein
MCGAQSNTESHGDHHGDSNTYRHCNSYRLGNRNSCGFAQPDRDTQRNAWSNTYTHAKRYRDTDEYTYFNAQQYSYREPYSDRHSCNGPMCFRTRLLEEPG